MWSLDQGSPKDLAKAHENEGGRKKMKRAKDAQGMKQVEDARRMKWAKDALGMKRAEDAQRMKWAPGC